MLRSALLSLAIVLSPLCPQAALADDAFVAAFQDRLAAADLQGAATLAQARISADSTDRQAWFALGAAQFLQAVEGLGQDLYDHGLVHPVVVSGFGPTISDLPFLRFPVPENPAPTPLTPQALRDIVSRFNSQLLTAEATLAQVPKGALSLPLDVQRIALDYDQDGKAAATESLPFLIAAIANVELRPKFPVVGFDESDVPWLRGYAHLLAGITDSLLAYDFSQTVEQTFHAAFPQSDLPSSPLNAQVESLERQYAENRTQEGDCWDYSYDPYDSVTSPEEAADTERRESCVTARTALEYGSLADVIAFIHLMRWPVTEPARLLTAREHFLSMIALSRESWALILGETDDQAEWVPGPKQTSLFPRMRVDDRILAGWMDFLDQAEGVLEGRLLLPHWRFDRSQGVNLRKMFEQPQTLDPVMILAGPGAIPFMEKGPLAPGSTYDTGIGILSGGLLAYFLWFN